MKILLLLLLPACAYSQIPVKSNAIKVTGVSFLDACKKLLDMGYEIKVKDNDLQTALTGQKHYVKSWNADYNISIRVKDSVLVITGKVTAPAGTGGLFDNEPLQQGRQAKNMFTVGFSYLDEYARSFGKSVEYLKQ